MALRTHFTQTKIGCPRIAEFTVQRTEALFDHITGDLGRILESSDTA